MSWEKLIRRDSSHAADLTAGLDVAEGGSGYHLQAAEPTTELVSEGTH